MTSILPFIRAYQTYFPAVIDRRECKIFETGTDSICAIILAYWKTQQKGAHTVWFPRHFCGQTLSRIRNILSSLGYEANINLYDTDTDLFDLSFEGNDVLIWVHFNRYTAISDVIRRELKCRDVFLLEDFVLASFDICKVVGDAAINSLRKISPLNISLAYSSMPLESYEPSSAYAELRRNAAWKKTVFEIIPEEQLENEFLQCFKNAEEILEGRQNIHCPVTEDLLLFERIDWEKILELRRSNYHVLHNRLSLTEETIVPGEYQYLMLKLNERDSIRKKLFDVGIYAPVHWLDSHSYLKNSLLSIPIDQRYNASDMFGVADFLTNLWQA